MNGEIKIRRADLKGRGNLAKIGWQSFDEAFADHPKNHPDDMRVYMNDGRFPSKRLPAICWMRNPFIYCRTRRRSRRLRENKLDLAKERALSRQSLLEVCRLYALDKFIGKGIGKI
jgi:hypothetical protein